MKYVLKTIWCQWCGKGPQLGTWHSIDVLSMPQVQYYFEILWRKKIIRYLLHCVLDIIITRLLYICIYACTWIYLYEMHIFIVYIHKYSIYMYIYSFSYSLHIGMGLCGIYVYIYMYTRTYVHYSQREKAKNKSIWHNLSDKVKMKQNIKSL